MDPDPPIVLLSVPFLLYRFIFFEAGNLASQSIFTSLKKYFKQHAILKGDKGHHSTLHTKKKNQWWYLEFRSRKKEIAASKDKE